MTKFPVFLVLFAIVIGTCTKRAAGDEFQAGQLTAADVDDNLNFDWYLQYQERMLGQESDVYYGEPVLPRPFLQDRVPIQVRDSAGEPFSSVQITIDGQKTFLTGTNGKLSLFPTLDSLSSGPWEAQLQPPGGTCPDDCVTATIPASPEVIEQAAREDENSTVRSTVNLDIAKQASSLPTELDIALLMDTTGSMCDEAEYLERELGQVLEESTSGVDVRRAYIAYKSRGDSYEVRVSPFGSTPNFADELSTEVCDGGGNGELVNEALQAVSQLEWRPGNVARMVLIVGDEPPHESLKEHMQEAFDAALDLRGLGVRVYALAASRTDVTAEYLFRLISFITGSRYLWLTDDSGIGDPHAEPKVLCYQVTHLDKLLYRVISSELTGKRVEADPSHIIREVGQQEAGVCLYDLNLPTGPEGTPIGPEGTPIAPADTPTEQDSGLLFGFFAAIASAISGLIAFLLDFFLWWL